MLAKIPKEARAETPKGAEAFVRFYLDSFNAAMSKPDPSALNGLYAASCKGCQALQDNSAALAKSKERHAGATLTFKKASTIRFVDDRKQVEAEVVQNAVAVVDASGNVVRRNSAKQGLFLFTLTYDRNWKIVRLQADAA